MKKIHSLINGINVIEPHNIFFNKYDPTNSNLIYEVQVCSKNLLNKSISDAENAFEIWNKISSIKRGEILFSFVDLIKQNKDELININALETGKSINSSKGEYEACISVANYFASEGMRLYSNNLPSSNSFKIVNTKREPLGVVALIVPANTAMANIFWKLFPALITGNGVILKASEDAPMLANFIGDIASKVNFPKGLISVIQGDSSISNYLVHSKQINLVSFTGSSLIGKKVYQACATNFTHCSLELGGKNAMIVMDDADFDNAIKWSLLSAFSNAGQRCASASRLLIHENIYDKFKNTLVKETLKLKLGVENDSDLGPLVNYRMLQTNIRALKLAVKDGLDILTGLENLNNNNDKTGYYFSPTIIENIDHAHFINQNELFGPLVTLNKFKNLDQAIKLNNSTNYGLTASIHTKNIDDAHKFIVQSETGLVNVNIGTYGSEPHMAFGGRNESGNGTREPGLQALDVYSQLKTYSITYDNN